MRIKQLYCNFGNHFADAIEKKYQLENRTTNIIQKDPLFMFGCYDYRQLTIALNHSLYGALTVICWAGTDAQMLTKIENPLRDFWPNQLRQHPNIVHVAISHWIADDLESLGIKHYRVPVTPHDYSELKPCPLGDSIYMYKAGSKLYNGGIYQQIKEQLPYNFIEADFGTYTREEILEVYENCFIGLRFTEHDGLSNTVCELGSMGRMVISNGDTPNCIHYDKNDPDEIIEQIHAEFKDSHDLGEDKTGAVARAVKDYLDIGDDFLNTEYYG
jgi:hypothetical protein